MQREMNEVCARFFGEGEHAGSQWRPFSPGYAPQVESWVRDNKPWVKADLPGIKPKDGEVMGEGNRLTLRGERKAEYEGKEGGYLRRAVRYRSFERSFTIPEGVKAEDITESYRNGVFELSMLLPAAMLPKKVTVVADGPEKRQQQIGTTK